MAYIINHHLDNKTNDFDWSKSKITMSILNVFMKIDSVSNF